MSMVGVAGAGADQIVVVDREATETDVRRIVVFAEGKAVVRLRPLSSGEETLTRPTHLDLGRIDPRRAHWFSISGRRSIG
jgi:hypothetical protein